MITSGAFVALLPYLAVLGFIVASVTLAIVRAIRHKPYIPPDVPDGRDTPRREDTP